VSVESRRQAAFHHFCEFSEANQRLTARSNRIYAVRQQRRRMYVTTGEHKSRRVGVFQTAHSPINRATTNAGYYERGGRRLTSQKVRLGSLDRWFPGNGSILRINASPTEPKNPTGKNHMANQSGF